MANEYTNRVVPGIPDEQFIRGDVPMTKEEVRCITLSKLQLNNNSRVLDIGAGTGSISIECALLAQKGIVYAVEKNQEAIGLIKENAARFKADNIQIIHGIAPDALVDLEAMDCIVIGGAGGKMDEILTECERILVPGGRIVINCILLESMGESLRLLQGSLFEDISTLQVTLAKSRPLGGKTMLQPLNPVFIISAQKKKEVKQDV